MNIPKEFSFRTRKEDFESAGGTKFDALIIGGGIIGAGVANLLAQNGVKALLVDKGDFASGTSSGSSKLIHGGLRYLAQGRILLTRDLLKERNYLMKNTDIVSRLDFDILMDEYSWKPYTIRLGLLMYNILGGKFRIPSMKENDGKYGPGVKGYFSYFDGMTDDSRLVIYNIVSAHNNGAICLNYASVTGLRKRGSEIVADLEDQINGGKSSVTADAVINCAGPWAEEVMKMYGVENDEKFRLSKGVHIIVSREDLPVDRAIAFRSHIDKRQMFVIPREEVVIIGTTDEFVDEPDDFSVPDEDVKYIIDSARRIFPSLSESMILTAYSGLRPLFGKGDSPGEVSRDFSIKSTGNFITVFGGKLTDYRSASRNVAEHYSRISGRKIRTKGLPRIDYRREKTENPYSYEIEYECAITFEDILRRREALSLYSRDLGESEKPRILESLKEAGLGDAS